MGAPVGNSNYLQGKLWNAAIRRALEEKSRRDGIEALDKVAETLIALAEGGDIPAIKELGDRLDGRPGQQIDLGGSLELTGRLVING